MGNIGPVKREIILEPFPESAPVEPSLPNVPVPSEPEKVPALT